MRRFSLILTVILVGACATETRYVDVLNNWLGAEEDELIASWGAPRSVHKVHPVERELTYVRHDCETTFIVINGYVRMWKYRGKECAVL